LRQARHILRENHHHFGALSFKKPLLRI